MSSRCDKEVGFTQYDGGNYTPEEDEIPPYENAKLEQIAHLLRGSYSNIRVHNVIRSRAEFGIDLAESRLVQFYVTERGDDKKVIVSVLLSQKWYEGGLTPWHVESVEIKVAYPTNKFSNKGEGKTVIINLRQISGNEDLWLSEQMEQNVRGFLYFC